MQLRLWKKTHTERQYKRPYQKLTDNCQCGWNEDQHRQEQIYGHHQLQWPSRARYERITARVLSTWYPPFPPVEMTPGSCTEGIRIRVTTATAAMPDRTGVGEVESSGLVSSSDIVQFHRSSNPAVQLLVVKKRRISSFETSCQGSCFKSHKMEPKINDFVRNFL